jgi:argininosuccinate lyase
MRALAAIRTQAGQAAGDVAAALTTLHTGSARTDHFHLLNGLVPRALDEAVATARLAAAVADGLTIDTDRMERVAREGFTAAADVADLLAMEGGLDYRSAHKVVGRAVRTLVEAGRPPSELTAELLSDAAADVLGEPLALDPAAVVEALDPAADVAVRRQVGSCSSEAMDAMLAAVDGELLECRRWSDRVRTDAAAAAERLRARARELAGS